MVNEEVVRFAYQLCAELEIEAAKRQIFLDANTVHRFKTAVALTVIENGFPSEETAKVLIPQYLDKLATEGDRNA